jgi:hypothetical protein
VISKLLLLKNWSTIGMSGMDTVTENMLSFHAL